MIAFRWFMRNGATILFWASVVIFVVSFVSNFFIAGHALEQMAPGQTSSRLWAFLGAFGQALSGSVWSFLGACLLYRVDQHWGASRK